jgi:hypothetical protein
MLGYQGFVLNAVDVNNNNSSLYLKCSWWKLLSRKHSDKFRGKLAFNAAISYKDKLYIGLNLNLILYLRQSSVFMRKMLIP